MRSNLLHALSLLPLLAGAAAAQPYRPEYEPPPAKVENLEVEQKLGARIPLDLVFADEQGKPIRLGEIWGDLPVVLTFNYSDCPQLCSVQLDALVDTLSEMQLEPATEFRVVTVSIDPLESATRARLTKDRYLRAYDRDGAREGWRFLTGEEERIRALADAVGFPYRWVNSEIKYAHPAAVILSSPEGVVTRYFGLMIEPDVLRYSLIEAADGKIGDLFDQMFLVCFKYDAENQAYTFAIGVMRTGGVLTLLFLGGFLWLMFRHERGRRRAAEGRDPAEAVSHP